jgi:hypothetical protein
MRRSAFGTEPWCSRPPLGKRLDAMALAMKTIRPAMQRFYDLLDDTQKTYFDAIGLRDNPGRPLEAISGEDR